MQISFDSRQNGALRSEEHRLKEKLRTQTALEITMNSNPSKIYQFILALKFLYSDKYNVNMPAEPIQINTLAIELTGNGLQLWSLWLFQNLTWLHYLRH